MRCQHTRKPGVLQVPHKADESYFEKKKPWSVRKDLILDHYITQYLPKVAYFNHKPILLVDGFAGRGFFLDGSKGSPIILANRLQGALDHDLPASVSLLAIERSNELFPELERALSPFKFATARHQEFLDGVLLAEEAAATSNVFLYVDPYAVEGLSWNTLDRVFRWLELGSSVEILLNFNGPAFARRARAALKLSKPDPPSTDEESSRENEEDWQRLTEDAPSVARLNDVVGGAWWQDIFKRGLLFSEEVQAVTTGFCRQLESRFRHVCVHEIKANPKHAHPKYALVFGSRSEEAIRIMNDAAVESTRLFAEQFAPVDPVLFELRSTDLIPDQSTLADIILDTFLDDVKMPKGHLIMHVIRFAFGQFSSSKINEEITMLIKTGYLQSQTGRSRVNDSVSISRAPGPRQSDLFGQVKKP